MNTPLVIASILLGFFPPPDSGIELGPPHVDASFGYSIRPPKDWLLHTERTSNPRDTLLLQMVDSAASNFPPDITVKLVGAPRGSTIAQIIAGIEHDLSEDYRDLTKSPPASQPVAGRPASRVSYRFTLSRTEVARQTSVIRGGPDQYFVISYTGPVEMRDRASRVFDA